jgi:hypothetical protein
MLQGTVLENYEFVVLERKMDKTPRAMLTHSSRRQISVAGELCLYSPNYTGPMSSLALRTRLNLVTGCRAKRRRRCPYEPGSNPGRRPGGRHAAQKALL